MATNHDLHKLKTDDEFKRLIPQLTEEERKQLEENIIQEGCRDAICIWNKTIVDGHNRYEICTKHKIPFNIIYLGFSCRTEAIAWICANQLGRRNITDKTRRYLIGKRYEMEKILGAKNMAGKNQHTKKEVCLQNANKPKVDYSLLRTNERLGEEYRVDPSTIVRCGQFARVVDTLSQAVPELHEKVTSGQLKLSQKMISKIEYLSSSEIQHVVAELISNLNGATDYLDAKNIIPKNMPMKEQLALMQIGAIKNMPKYDPDAEIRSLSYTVPSWASSISRVLEKANFKEASNIVCEKLNVELLELKVIIEKMELAIKEKKS